jgi:PKD repeat protein
LVTLTATNTGGSDNEVHTVTCDAAGCVFTP